MANRDVLSYRPHFLRDWDSSETVRMMGYAARGIYHALLDAQWNEGSIPAEPEHCARLLRCEAEEWAQFAEFFEHCFPKDGDRRKNKRLNDEREAVLAKVAKCREVAALGGKAKANGKANAKQEQKENLSESVANASETLERIASHTDTDTDYSLANASGASGDDAEVIEAEVNEAEIVPEPAEPYATVERVLMAMDGKPVPASKVRRYLREDSPIRGLVAQYGEADATRLIIWAAKHKRLNVATVYGSSGVLWDEAVSANWGPPGAMKGKAPGDRERVLMEAVGLG